MEISSPAFEYNMPIPAKYTCQGENLSPPLAFGNIPKDAKSLVLIVDDPDAPHGTFDHWLVWNIPSNSTGLLEAQKGLETGINSYMDNRYRGPCPPPGSSPHHYHFKLYALDMTVDLPSKTTKKQLEAVIKDHILDKAELIGTFQR